MSIEIKFGVSKNQRGTVAKIFYDAFGDKFNIIFGNETNAIALIAECLDDEKTIVALKDGVAVGFSGLQYSGKSFIDPNMRQVVRAFGLSSFRVAVIGLFFLFKRTGGGNELLLESLAVSANERNQGIGRKLLQFTIDYARAKKFPKLKLEVIETNKNARRLYEKIGFVESKTHNIPYPISKIMGFGSVIEMVYQL